MSRTAAEPVTETDIDLHGQPPRPPGCARCGCVLLLLMIVPMAVAAWFFCLRVPPLRIAEDTTRITGPLTPDGKYIDFLQALELKTYPPEMRTDDNGFRVFLRTFGDVAAYRNNDPPDGGFYTSQKYAKLGLDPQEPPTLVFPQWPETILKESLPNDEHYRLDEMCQKFKNPWTLDDLSAMTDWLVEAEEPLNALADMVSKPVFCIPFLETREAVINGKPTNIAYMPMPDLKLMRDVTRALLVRANYRIGMGNIDGAIDDAITCMRLGRHLTHNNCVVCLLMGMVIEDIGYSLSFGADPEHPPTVEQLRRFLASIDSLRPRSPIENVIKGERLLALSDIDDAMKGGEGYLEDFPQIIKFLGKRSDPNVVYQEINFIFDKLDAGCLESGCLPDDISSSDAFQSITTRGRSRLFAWHYSDMLLSVIEAAHEAVRRRECALNMKRIGLALLLYEAEHGSLPPNHWPDAIRPYFLKDGDAFPACPSHRGMASGQTAYVMVRYGQEERPGIDTLLLAEYSDAVDLNDAEIAPEKVLEGLFEGHPRMPQSVGSYHAGGMNVFLRNGAVNFISVTQSRDDLHALVGRTPPEQSADNPLPESNDGEPPGEP